MPSRKHHKKAHAHVPSVEGASQHPSETTPLIPPAEDQSLPWHKRPHPMWALTALFLVYLSQTSLTAPTLQFILKAACEEYYENGNGSNSSLPFLVNCDIPEVQTRATQVFQADLVASNIATLLMAAFWLSHSDTHGRRYALIFSATGQVIAMILLIIYARFWRTLSIWFIVVVPFTIGILGGTKTLVTVCYAYVSDCLPPSRRTKWFGRLAGAAALAGTIGPSMSATVFKTTGQVFEIVVYIPLALYSIWFILVIFFLPESNSHHVRSASSETEHQKTLLQKLNIFSALNILRSNPTLPLLAIIHFLMNISEVGVSGVALLYPSYIFHWGTWESGLYLSLVNFESLVVLVFLVPLIRMVFKKRGKRLEQRNRKLAAAQAAQAASASAVDDVAIQTSSALDGTLPQVGPAVTKDEHDSDTEPTDTVPTGIDSGIVSSLSNWKTWKETSRYRSKNRADSNHDNVTSKRDSWMVVAGEFINICCYLGYALATQSWMYYASITFHALATIYSPAIRCMFTTIVNPNEVGAVLGAVTVLETTAGFLAPLIYSTVYAETVSTQPNLVFYLLAANMVISTGIALIAAIMERRKKKYRVYGISHGVTAAVGLRD